MGTLDRDLWAQRYTLGQLTHWDDPDRYELVDGRLYPITEEIWPLHDAVVRGLRQQLNLALAASAWGLLASGATLRLSRGDETDDMINTLLRPDAAITCHPFRQDSRGLRGAPEWVAEVVSPQSALMDHMVKRQVYERFGVAEYWLVNPFERILTMYHLGMSGYGKPDLVELSGETQLSILPGIYLTWDEMLRPFWWGED